MERLREDILDLGQADGHVLVDGETWQRQNAGGACAHASAGGAGGSSSLPRGAMDEARLAAPAFRPALRMTVALPLGEGGAWWHPVSGRYRGAEPPNAPAF